MNVRRRCAVGMIALSVMLTAGLANAQALKQLPAKPLVVIKVNNPQAVSQRLGAISQKLGLAAMQPMMADPLGALKQQLGVKNGLDAARDIAVGIYAPAQGKSEPGVVVLLPVSDYKAFLGNFQGVKTEAGVDSFQIEGDDVFAANWGTYAALTPDKAMLAQKPAGVELAPAAAGIVDKGDIVAWFDVNQAAAMGLPEFRKQRGQIVADMERELKGQATFNQKFTPVVKTLVVRVLDVVEGAMETAQWSTVTLNVAEKGIGFSSLCDFKPGSYAGNLIQGYKASNKPLLMGLPDRKYFAFGGMAIDAKAMTKIVDDFSAPVLVELKNAGPDGQNIASMVDAAKNSISALESVSFGYVQPTGQPGQQAIIQQVAVYTGDAKKIAETQKQSMEATKQLMKLLPQTAEVSMNFGITPNAKTVDGVALDQFKMDFKFDQNDPNAAQAAQMVQMIYGPGGMSGYLGAADQNSYIMAMGGNDELLAQLIAAAKADAAPLAQATGVEAVSAQFEKNRVAVYYVSVDNIVTTAMQYAAMFGVPVKLQLPPNLPPIGMSMGTQDTAVRGELFVPMELIEGIVGAAMRMMMQQGGGQPGAL